MPQKGFIRFTRLFVVRLWGWYLAGMVFLAGSNIITLEIPQLAKDIVNRLQDQLTGEDHAHLSQLALAIILLGASQIVIRSLSRILIFWPGRKLEASSKSYLFERALQLSQLFFDRYGMGDLISRLSNDLGQLRVFFAFAILQIMNLIFIASFTLYKMMQMHAALTVTSLIPILFMLVMARYVMPRLQRFTKKNQEAIGRLSNRVTECFTNIHVIQANAREASFAKLIEIENEKVFESDMRVLVLRTLFFPLMTSLTALSQIVVLFFGGYLIIERQLTVGDILAFNFYLAYLAFPLTSIGIILAIYQRSKSALERIDPIFDEPLEHDLGQIERASSSPSTNSVPLLQVEGLSFQYPDATTDRWALRDIGFELREGEILGICGPVGCGKSTLLQLLTRLYNPPPGTIHFRGHDLLSYRPEDLRQDIAYAQQHVHLFSNTIRENLTFGLDPKPNQAELEAAATAAQILREIEQFPQGWNTEIGERGLRLSGGQKQRLALARVLLRKCHLLLLDDVLSAVDNITEARLIAAFKQIRTSLIISSHRSSVLEACDHVLLMAAGRIVDQGSFAALIQRHPHLKEELHEQDPRLETHEEARQ